MIESPIFRLTDHGVEIVNDWPAETCITRELLEQGDPELLVRRGRTVTFLPGHQLAMYRMVGRDSSRNVYLLRRL